MSLISDVFFCSKVFLSIHLFIHIIRQEKSHPFLISSILMPKTIHSDGPDPWDIINHHGHWHCRHFFPSHPREELAPKVLCWKIITHWNLSSEAEDVIQMRWKKWLKYTICNIASQHMTDIILLCRTKKSCFLFGLQYKIQVLLECGDSIWSSGSGPSVRDPSQRWRWGTENCWTYRQKPKDTSCIHKYEYETINMLFIIFLEAKHSFEFVSGYMRHGMMWIHMSFPVLVAQVDKDENETEEKIVRPKREKAFDHANWQWSWFGAEFVCWFHGITCINMRGARMWFRPHNVVCFATLISYFGGTWALSAHLCYNPWKVWTLLVQHDGYFHVPQACLTYVLDEQYEEFHGWQQRFRPLSWC